MFCALNHRINAPGRSISEESCNSRDGNAVDGPRSPAEQGSHAYFAQPAGYLLPQFAQSFLQSAESLNLEVGPFVRFRPTLRALGRYLVQVSPVSHRIRHPVCPYRRKNRLRVQPFGYPCLTKVTSATGPTI